MSRKLADDVVDELRGRDLLALVQELAARRGVLLHHLSGATRTPSGSRPRREARWRLRPHSERGYGLFEIARLFGRYHTTVLAGIAAHERRLASAATPFERRS